jgi:aldehyde:ferredoxin oxidoreductase
VKDDHYELRDASNLWGKDTWQTESLLRHELGDHNIKALKIGPAGENQCFSSAIIGDLARACGKCSLAAIWGAKRLKAVAVRGTKGVRLARPREMTALAKELWQRFKDDPMYASHTRYGTNTWVGDTVMRSMGGIKPELSSEAFEKLYDKNLSCSGCALHCSHWLKVKSGKYAGTEGEGLEGNTQLAGFDMGVGAEFITYYNNICNKLGLDTMHPAGAIGWALDLYKDGIITRADTDGLEVVRGNEEVILKLIDKIVKKEGFGALLDKYPLRAAAELGRGSENYISHRKGYPSPYTGFMSSVKTTLAHAVATRAHDHLTGSPGIESPNRQPEMTNEVLEKLGMEMYGDPKFFTDVPYIPQKKYAQRVWECENYFAMADMTGVCKFAAREVLLVKGIDIPDFSRLLTAATGIEFSAADCTRAAEREILLERAFNAREGIRRIDDYPFALWYLKKYGKPHPIYNKLRMSEEDYGKLLDMYYDFRGCDPATGIPTRDKLSEVGLREVAADLETRGLMPQPVKSGA